MIGMRTRKELAGIAPRDAMDGQPDLGMPLSAERVKARRREQLFERAFRLGGLIVCLCVGAAVGFNAAIQRETLENAILSVPRDGVGNAEPAIPLAIRQRRQAARLAMGKRVCALDALGCLVCISKPAPGQAIVSTHC